MAAAALALVESYSALIFSKTRLAWASRLKKAATNLIHSARASMPGSDVASKATSIVDHDLPGVARVNILGAA